ncbi:MAG TPA: septum formation initiator family protein [Blastocatellia bacterium]|nr:septum formation initiator family protein [Blastocatellia bacterium]
MKPAVNSYSTKTQVNPLIGIRGLLQALHLPAYVWLGMVILAMAALSVTTLVRGREAARLAEASYQARQQQLQTMMANNEHLRHETASFKSDPKAIEREARKKLNYVAPNEIVIIPR